MNWERFFFYLHRVNAVCLAAFLVFIGFIAISEMTKTSFNDDYTDQDEYGSLGLEGTTEYEGEEIQLTEGAVTKYVIADEEEEDSRLEGSNVSLTHMQSGKSRLILPEGSKAKILRFEHVGCNGEGDSPAMAYIALVGTGKNYEEGEFDLVIGRLSDLEQTTIVKNLHFIDSPRMIDDTTMSMIAWPKPEAAEFWLIDLETLEIVTKRELQLPNEKV